MIREAIGIGLISLCVALVPTTPASACSITSTEDASFGSHTSFNIVSETHPTSSVSSGLSCGGSILSLGATNHIYATISSANGSKLANAGADKISYKIYADAAESFQLNAETQYDFASSQLLDLVGIFGGPVKPLPLYFRTVAGSVVKEGLYEDTVTIRWAWDYCYGIGLLGACLGRSASSGESTFKVSVNITNDCTISTSPVVFGSAPTVATFREGNGTISLTCTKGLAYTVGLGGGKYAASNGRRAMANGSNRLEYDLYHGDTVWRTSSGRVDGGVSDGVAEQQLEVTARIYHDQATPQIGTYTDSVIIDVKY